MILSALAAWVEWPDTYESRGEMLALLETINAELLTGSSATRTLEVGAATI